MVHAVPFHLYRSSPCGLLLYVTLFHLEIQLANVCFCHISYILTAPRFTWVNEASGITYLAQEPKHAGSTGAETHNIDALVVMSLTVFHWTMHALMEHVSNHAAKEMKTQLILILANWNKIEFLSRV